MEVITDGLTFKGTPAQSAMVYGIIGLIAGMMLAKPSNGS